MPTSKACVAGNRGHIDLPACKQDMRTILFRKAEVLSGAESHERLEGQVRDLRWSIKSWYDAERTTRTWQTGRQPYEIDWVNLFIEVAFGTQYDSRLRMVVRSNHTADQALEQTPALAERWDQESCKELRPTSTLDARVEFDATAGEAEAADDSAVFEFHVRKKAKINGRVDLSSFTSTKPKLNIPRVSLRTFSSTAF